MNPRIKRLLSLLMALAMVLSLTAPVTASAASTTDADSNTVEIAVGETVKLKVSGIFSKVTWTSSDEEIATVSEKGVVEGIAPGTVTITAANKKLLDSTEVIEFTVIVTEPLTVKTGETLQLAVETSGCTVTWKSSDKKIATVDSDGLVTALREGEVTVTATEKKSSGSKWIFWGGDSKATTIIGTFNIIVLPADEQPTEPENTTYTVTFESNGGSEVVPQVVAAGKTVAEPEDPTREGYEFAGWYLNPEIEKFTGSFNFSGTAITEDIVLYAGWISMNDTDEDGLVDGLETHYGTDITDPDTDDDGLSDYIEVVILGTNPLSPETDGVSDADQDSDGDGISNVQELEQGTNPGDNDTDADLLTDDEEMDLGTNPADYDTDGDGASDGTEVRLGTDPLTADETFYISLKSGTEDSVVPSVDIQLAGNQVDSLAVDPLYDDTLFAQDLPGYMGHAYQFTVDGSFESATIKFEFDTSVLEEGAIPTIYYYNPETQMLEELDTTIDGNIASTVVEHFSVYILLNKVAFDKVWESEIKPPDTETDDAVLDIVFVIDYSLSMEENDPDQLFKKLSKEFITKLRDGTDRAAIVKFIRKATLVSALTTDKATLNTAVDSIAYDDGYGTYSGTDGSAGIHMALEQLTNSDSAYKYIVFVTDGEDNGYSYSYDDLIEQAVASGVNIYTVGMGSASEAVLQKVADGTGGKYYHATTTAGADEILDLDEVFNEIESETIDYATDSNVGGADGISDYFTKLLCDGTLRLGTGMSNPFYENGISYDEVQQSKDYDGDGIDNGQELIVIHDESTGKVYLKMKSDPTKVDTDNDTIHDMHDPDPMEFTITDRVLSWIEGLSYTNLADYVGNTLGQAIEKGAVLKNISTEYASYLENAVIVDANNSGVGYWKDFWDSGLGYVAIKIVRRNEPAAVIFALRGTEPEDDILNDAAADLVLGVGWDDIQSKNAFAAYKKLAVNKAYDYYVTGHSLGGRLAQDVIYKTYNANEGGWFKEKANIPVPVHSVTFNALGYNKIVYATLENDLLRSYKDKLTNYYYWLDFIGEAFGCKALYSHAGTDVKLTCKQLDGTSKRQEEEENWVNIWDLKHHGIEHFHSDYDLLYADSDAPSKEKLPGKIVPHNFSYWVN